MIMQKLETGGAAASDASYENGKRRRMNAKVTLTANKGELTNVDYDLLPTYASKMFIDPPMVVRPLEHNVDMGHTT